jgi:hypothetical protein
LFFDRNNQLQQVFDLFYWYKYVSDANDVEHIQYSKYLSLLFEENHYNAIEKEKEKQISHVRMYIILSQSIDHVFCIYQHHQ